MLWNIIQKKKTRYNRANCYDKIAKHFESLFDIEIYFDFVQIIFSDFHRRIYKNAKPRN